jgi:hypothetical protein
MSAVAAPAEATTDGPGTGNAGRVRRFDTKPVDLRRLNGKDQGLLRQEVA